MKPAFNRKKRFVRRVRIALAILVVLVAIDVWLVRMGRIRQRSMEPVLSDGDWVFFDKTVMRRGGPKRFDIVMFKGPDDPDKIFIKRVIAVGNEIVEVDDGRLLVNGIELEKPDGAEWGELEIGPHVVRPAHYYVLGDNLRESLDSRAWGDVPRDYIMGRVLWRFWPVGNWRIFRREDVRVLGVEDGDKGIQAYVEWSQEYDRYGYERLDKEAPGKVAD